MVAANLTMAPNGRLVIPANMRAELGMQNGGKFVVRIVDGTIVLEPLDTAVRRVQAMVARYVPKNAGLVDELIADRRRAAEHE